MKWTSDGDALYVLEETRKLFRQNQNLRELSRIQTKLEEAEMRYGLAVHYKIPYPRMFHKTHGNTPDSLGSYATYLDSHYDYSGCQIHPGMSGAQRSAPSGVNLGDQSISAPSARAPTSAESTIMLDIDEKR